MKAIELLPVLIIETESLIILECHPYNIMILTKKFSNKGRLYYILDCNIIQSQDIIFYINNILIPYYAPIIIDTKLINDGAAMLYYMRSSCIYIANKDSSVYCILAKKDS